MLDPPTTDEEKTRGIRNVVALQNDTEHSMDRFSINFIFIRLLTFHHFYALFDADERCICKTYPIDHFWDSFINSFIVDTT